MRIILNANPRNAPCCVIVIAKFSRLEFKRIRDQFPGIKREQCLDALIQSDWDFPSTAEFFGWSTRHAPDKSTLAFRKGMEECIGCGSTDGTVKCNVCGKDAIEFIMEARQFIDDHDGKIIRVRSLPEEFKWSVVED